MAESKLREWSILRMVIVGTLALFLLIPTYFVESVVEERGARRNSAANEVSQSWGASQTITGPIVTIPFKEFSKDDKGNLLTSTRYAHFLPSRLSIRSALEPEIRYRGIYQVALYKGRFEIEGAFSSVDLSRFNVQNQNILWKEAFVTLGITDLKGVRDTVNLTWNKISVGSAPGVQLNDIVSSGVTFTPTIGASSTFSLTLNLNGSSEISFIPLGEITTATMESDWIDPSFTGGFLPTKREITHEGFRAEWKVLNLNRNFPQAWIGDRYKVAQSAFGARLYLPVDHYQKTTRTVKYALLFIVLTFASLFLSEMMARTVLHPIQYALIGFALILFYLLLLSLSEHLGFDLAYVISTVLVVALVSLYTSWIAVRKRIALTICVVLTILYSFLYVTLQIQDYALLIGAFGLLVTLGIIMYVTRSIDWFSLENLTQDKRSP
jgi:inner membrane protein